MLEKMAPISPFRSLSVAVFLLVTLHVDAFSYRTMMARSIGGKSSGCLVTRLYASSSSTSFPDLQALSSAPFMQQVQYEMELTTLLENSNTNDVGERLKASLKAQLSHSDGIRGFMVAYLSGGSSSDSNDNDEAPLEVPKILLEAFQDQLQQEATEDLVSLMCMNVIMPTAMVTMHQDAEQSANSARTAQRGLALLQAVQQHNSAFVKNLSAIRQVARQVQGNCDNDSTTGSNDSEGALIQKWTDFFEKWGYQQQQAADIEKAMDKLL
jgi:hypothetical protein